MPKEHQYLVDRYAQSLTKYEVKTLFERLRVEKGSVSAATRDIELSRKTFYDWESSSDDVKMSTKRKVLEANLEMDLDGTIDFLVKKTALDYNEILERYVNTTGDRILAIEDQEEFNRELSRFTKSLKEHSGALTDIRTIHLKELFDTLNTKASSLSVDGIEMDLHFMNFEVISQKFIQLLEVLDMKTMFKNEIASKLGLPKEFVEKACKAASYLDPPIITEKIPGFSGRGTNRITLKEMSFVETDPLKYIYAQKDGKE